MALTVTSKRLPEDPMEGGEDDQGRHTFKETFRVTQTDGGALASPIAMAIAATAVMSGDPIPLRGDNYSYAGFTDPDAFALSYAWRRAFTKDDLRIVDVVVTYGAASGADPGRLGEPNPLLWPTEYWLEFTDELVPIKSAKNVDDLSHIGRPVNTDGPITNSAGEEPVEPFLKSVRYPILCCQKPYATLDDIIVLNDTYQDSTNNNTFFGADARKAAYLGTESGRITRTQGQSYYLGVTKIWFKKLTWDLRSLNIGFNELQKVRDGDGLPTDAYILDPLRLGPQLFRCMVKDYRFNSDGSVFEEAGWSPSSEPLKLQPNGTREQPTVPASNLTYREREELDYLSIGIGGA